MMNKTKPRVGLMFLVIFVVALWGLIGLRLDEMLDYQPVPLPTLVEYPTIQPDAAMNTPLALPALDVLPTQAPDAEAIQIEYTDLESAPPDSDVQATYAAPQPLSSPQSTSTQLAVSPDVISPPIPQAPASNQIVIQFNPGSTPDEQRAYIQSLGGTVIQTISPLSSVVVTIPDTISSATLPESPIIASSEPDYLVAAQMEYPIPTNDPYYAEQWALPVIGAPEAWAELPEDAPKVTVAVIDSGICLDHPDLAGRILPGYDFVEGDTIPQDELGHGCGVAGIIAANTNNGIGIAGVAPNALVMPLRVLDVQGIGTYSDVAAAIVYAVDHGARIINLSLGGQFPSSLLEEAVNYAAARDVTMVAAAGNTGGDVLYPAKYEPVIAVGSLDEDLQISSFSANGVEIDVWAPGNQVLVFSNITNYIYLSGTSFAAPYVTGIAALRMALNQILEIADTPIISTPTTTPTVIPSESADLLATIEIAITEFFAGDANGILLTPESIETDGDWAFARAVINANAESQGGSPGMILVIGHRTDNVWQAAVESTAAFLEWLPNLPDTLLSAQAKAVLSGIGAQFDSQLNLPWPQGETWGLSGGPHDIRVGGCTGCAYTQTSSALDFVTRVASGSNSGIITPAGAGVAFTVPTCTPMIRVEHGNGLQTRYHHLEEVLVTSGQVVFPDTPLGRPGGRNCSNSIVFAPHLDFAILDGPNVFQDGVDLQDLEIGGWRIARTTGQYDGTMTRLSDGLVRTADAAVGETRDILNGNPADTTYPTGKWLSPNANLSVGSKVTLSTTASDTGSGVSLVRFTAYWDGWSNPDEWYVITSIVAAPGTNVYSYTWDLCASPIIPNGTVTIGMDVTDLSGNTALSPDGTRTIQKVIDCSGTTTSVNWTGAGDNLNWNNASNWSTNAVPVTTDNVFINAPGTDKIVVASSTTINALYSDTTIEINSGGLTVNTDMQMQGSDLNLNGGLLSVRGLLTVNQTFNWMGGSLTGAGRTQIQSGATLNIGGTVAKTITGHTLEISGQAVMTGTSGISMSQSAMIRNLSGAVFAIQGSNSISATSTETGTFENAGTLSIATSAISSFSSRINFINNGTVEVNAGSLTISGWGIGNGLFRLLRSISGSAVDGQVTAEAAGDPVLGLSGYNFESGSGLNGDGIFNANGTVYFNGNTSISGSITRGGSGSMQVNGVLTISSNMIWSSGTMRGAGVTRIASGTTLTISGTSSKYIDGHTLENAGTIVWIDGNIALTNNALLHNLPGALFDIQTDADISDGTDNAVGIASIINEGIWRKSAGTATVIDLDDTFANTGSVEALANQLYIMTGSSSGPVSIQVASGATLNWGWTTIYDPGFFTINDGSVLTVQGDGVFEIGAGAVDGIVEINGNVQGARGTLTVNNQLTINGALTNTSVSWIRVNGTAIVNGPVSNAGTFVIDGLMTANGGGEWIGTIQGTGKFQIAAGTTMTISGTTDKYLSGATVENAGTIVWTGGQIALTNNAVLHNLPGALFDIQASASFNDGTTSTTGIASIVNEGIWRKSAGTATVIDLDDTFANTGSIEALADRLYIMTGSSSGPVSIQVASGATLNWGYTTIYDPGSFTINDGSVLTVQGDGIFEIGAGAVDGIVEINGNVQGARGTLTVNNQLTINGALSNVSLSWIRVNGTAIVNGPVSNAGVLVIDGLMTANGGGAWTAGTVQGTGKLQIPSGTTLTLSGTDVKTLSGATLENAGTIVWTGGQIALTSNAVLHNLPGAVFDIQASASFNDGTTTATGIASIVNEGIWRKSAGTATVIDLDDTFANTGSIEALADRLYIMTGSSSGPVSIQVASGATLNWGYTTVYDPGFFTINDGSVLTVQGAGIFEIGAGAVDGIVEINGNVYGARGTLTVNNQLTINGALSNISLSWIRVNGTAIVNGPVSNAGVLVIDGLMTANGGGAWTAGTVQGTGKLQIPSGTTLTLSGTDVKTLSGATLENAGTIVWTGGQIALTSNAVLHNLPGAVFDIQASASFNDGTTTATGIASIVNEGIWRKSAGTTTVIDADDTFTNTGSIDVLTSTLNLSSGFVQNAGQTTLYGTFLGTGTLNFQGGNLAGTGKVNAITNNSAIVSPGGAAIGKLEFASSYNQNAAGILNIQLGGYTAGTTYDQIAVTGAATLAGTLRLSLANNFFPQVGDSFTIATFGSRSGTFSVIDAQLPDVEITVSYGSTSVLIQVTGINSRPIASDDIALTNEDESVVIPVMQNDSHSIGGSFSVSSVGTPSAGSAALQADGTILYVPDADFFGDAVFSYSIMDGAGIIDTAVVTVTVLPINDAPQLTVTNNPLTYPAGETAVNSGLYSDVDSTALIFSATLGSVSPDGNGNWSWTYATNHDTSSQLVTITASDPEGVATDISFNLTVNHLPPTAPTDLIRNSSTQTTINLGWADNAVNESAYFLERSADGLSWSEIAQLPANSTSYEDTGLVCETGWQYRIRAYHNTVNVYSGYSNTLLTATSPCDVAAPAALSIANTDQMSIALNWADNANNETAYLLERSADGGSNWIEITQVAANSTGYTDNSAVCETGYSYRVRAYRSASGVYSEYSNIVSGSTTACDVASPANLQAAADSSVITLSWLDQATNETDYFVERSADGGSNWTQLAQLPADSTGYADTNLLCQTAYSYRVRAYRSISGVYSDYVTLHTATSTCAPLQPASLQVGSSTQTSISLSWALDSTASSAVLHANTGQGWTQIAGFDPSVTTYTHTNLTCASLIQYRVQTLRQQDASAVFSPILEAPTAACDPLTIPAAPVVTDIGRSTIGLQLTSLSQADNLRLERGTGGNWIQIAVISSVNNSYTDSGLLCGTAYDYRVRAYRNQDGVFSAYSPVASTSTSACLPVVSNTVGLYKDGNWIFRDTNSSGSADVALQFGPLEPGWNALVGDWDGDGVDGIGLYRNGRFVLRNSSSSGPIDLVLHFGPVQAGWIPIAGDWDGDNIDTVGIYKDGTFLLTNSLTNGQIDYRFSFGPAQADWYPVAGDWNGSGSDSVGIFRNGEWLLTDSVISPRVDLRFTFGPLQAGWLPLAGNWDATGGDGIGLYSASIWRLRNAASTGSTDIGFNFGQTAAGWQPLASFRGGISGAQALSEYANHLSPFSEPLSTITPTLEAEIMPLPTEIPTQGTEVAPLPTMIPTDTATAPTENIVTPTEAATVVPEPTDEPTPSAGLPPAEGTQSVD